MKDYMPQQVEVWYVIPAIRKEFARIMINKGLSQKQAADRLGITEAAVSQYVKKKRAKGSLAFGIEARQEMEKSVARIMAGGSTLREIQSICGIAKSSGVVCRVSQKLGYAPKGCRECFA